MQLDLAEAAGERRHFHAHLPGRSAQGRRPARRLGRQGVCGRRGHGPHPLQRSRERRPHHPHGHAIGQIEEGPPGVSIVAIDNGVVSWRFHPVEDGRPQVLITSPADRRLITDRTRACRPPGRHAGGSGRDGIGAWPERDLFGTQRGPNRSGRKW